MIASKVGAGQVRVVSLRTIGLTRRFGTALLLITVLYSTLYVFCILLPSNLGLRIPSWGTSATINTTPLAVLNSLVSDTDARQPTIGKVSMLYGDPDPIYVRALASHEVHALQHGYPLYVLREPLIEGIWAKVAYLQAVITAELSRPPEERLKWLFWFDADSYVLNPNVPLETFLPPEDDPAFRNISFLGGHDHRGLNAGVLIVRVDRTALHLMSTSLALPRFRPDLKLKFAEQTALSLILDTPLSVLPTSPHPDDDPPEFFATRSAIVPQRWFNAYLGERAWNGTKLQDLDGKPRKEKANSVKPGDLLVHFAGHSQEKRDGMTTFINAAETNATTWVRPFTRTGLDDEVRRFWLRWKAEQRSARKHRSHP